jgi:hypothetical protein
VALAIAARNARANAVELFLHGTPLVHAPCPAQITCILDHLGIFIFCV